MLFRDTYPRLIYIMSFSFYFQYFLSLFLFVYSLLFSFPFNIDHTGVYGNISLGIFPIYVLLWMLMLLC